MYETRTDHDLRPKVIDIKALFREAASCVSCATRPCGAGDASPSALLTASGCPINSLIPDFWDRLKNKVIYDALDKMLTDKQSANLTAVGLKQVILDLTNISKNREAAIALREAVDKAYENNPLPEITGRTCPQEAGLCQGGQKNERASCTVGRSQDQSLAIGAGENFLGYVGRVTGWFAESLNTPLHGEKVFIVGGGPAGMAAAVKFRKAGYKVEMAYREERIGGLLTYGLPGSKINKDDVGDYGRIFKDTPGMILMEETTVDGTLVTQKLKQGNDIILAVGAQKAKKLDIPGGEYAVNPLKFLRFSIVSNNILKIHPDHSPPESHDSRGQSLDPRGKKRIIVLGGGDTAADAVGESIRAAFSDEAIKDIREGNVEVFLAYRGPIENIKMVENEYKRILGEGAQVLPSKDPAEIEKAVGEFGDEYTVTFKDGSKLTSDLVVRAIGFLGEKSLDQKLGIPGLQQDDRNAIVVADSSKDFRVVVRLEKDPMEESVAALMSLLTEESRSAPKEGPLRPLDHIFAVGDAVQIASGGRCLVVMALHDSIGAFNQIESRRILATLDL